MLRQTDSSWFALYVVLRCSSFSAMSNSHLFLCYSPQVPSPLVLSISPFSSALLHSLSVPDKLLVLCCTPQASHTVSQDSFTIPAVTQQTSSAEAHILLQNHRGLNQSYIGCHHFVCSYAFHNLIPTTDPISSSSLFVPPYFTNPIFSPRGHILFSAPSVQELRCFCK